MTTHKERQRERYVIINETTRKLAGLEEERDTLKSLYQNLQYKNFKDAKEYPRVELLFHKVPDDDSDDTTGHRSFSALPDFKANKVEILDLLDKYIEHIEDQIATEKQQLKQAMEEVQRLWN